MTQFVEMRSKQKEEVMIVGDFNIDMLQIKERNKISEYFDPFTTNSFYPKITLPTQFSQKRETLIGIIFCKLSPATMDKRGGVILTDVWDHLPCYTAIEKKVKSIGFPKRITIEQQNTDTIASLIDDLNTHSYIKQIIKWL